MMFIKLYQWLVSPLLGPRCRFYPCCSDYMLQAFQKHHWLKAALLSSYRILRCQPLSRGGYDPVPNTNHSSPTNNCYKQEQQS